MSSFDKSEVKIDTLAHGMWTIEATALARGALRGAHRARRRRALAGGGARRGVRSLRAGPRAGGREGGVPHDRSRCARGGGGGAAHAAAGGGAAHAAAHAAAGGGGGGGARGSGGGGPHTRRQPLRNKTIWLHKTPSHTLTRHTYIRLHVARPHDRRQEQEQPN